MPTLARMTVMALNVSRSSEATWERPCDAIFILLRMGKERIVVLTILLTCSMALIYSAEAK